MKKILVLVGGISLMILGGIVFAVLQHPQSLMASDDSIITTQSDGQTEREAVQTYLNTLQGQTIQDYHIVYYIPSESLVDADTLSPDLMRFHLGADIVFSWPEVTQLHEQRPIDALIIHESGYEDVDQVWTRSAYRNGTAIVLVNLYFDEMKNLTGNGCIDRLAQPIFEPNYYVISSYQLGVENEAIRSQLNEIILATCQENISTEQLEGVLYLSREGAQYTLNNDSDYELLASTLVAMIFNYR